MDEPEDLKSTGLLRGEFQASISGAIDTLISGNATYYVDSDWGTNGYTDIELRTADLNRLVNLNINNAAGLENRRYSVVTNSTQADDFETGYFSYGDPILASSGVAGSVEIYQVENDRIEGSFSFEGEGFYGSDIDDRVSFSVNGTFNAKECFFDENFELNCP